MPIQERDYATPKLNESARLLGVINRKMPHLLDDFAPEGSYILFAASDQSNPVSLQETADILSVSPKDLRNFYRFAMTHIWVSTIGRIPEDFNSRELRPQWKRERRQRGNGANPDMSETMITHWQDPEFRRRMVESRKAEWQRPVRGGKTNRRIDR